MTCRLKMVAHRLVEIALDPHHVIGTESFGL